MWNQFIFLLYAIESEWRDQMEKQSKQMSTILYWVGFLFEHDLVKSMF